MHENSEQCRVLCMPRRKHILQQIRNRTVYTLPGIVHWIELRVATVREMSLKEPIRAQKYSMCDVKNKLVLFPKKDQRWYAMCDCFGMHGAI